MQYSYLVVYITVPSREVGQEIANVLVEGKLAACVNIVSGISSVFAWQGDIEQGDELLLIAKTRTALFDRLATTVKRVHPYDVPEIIAVPVVEGSRGYLRWLDEAVGK